MGSPLLQFLIPGRLIRVGKGPFPSDEGQAGGNRCHDFTPARTLRHSPCQSLAGEDAVRGKGHIELQIVLYSQGG